MAIVGVKEVIFGVDDLERCSKFWSDFGLVESPSPSDGKSFETAEGSVISIHPDTDSRLPVAPVEGNTARRIVWGVDDKGDIDRLASKLKSAGVEFQLRDDVLSCVDPCGYAISFKYWQRRDYEKAGTKFNAPGEHHRVDEAAPAYTRAHPPHLAHVVLLSPQLDEMIAFYRDVIGFKISDSYPGFSCFLRAPGVSDHHNLYLLRRGTASGFHHIAFDVRDVHELFGGGLFMQGQGWKTHLGPGRHPTSSAYFWYFVNPCGGAAEYDFDADSITDAWVPRSMVPSPELFAEWALHDGITRYKGEQKTFANKSGD